MIKVFFSEAMCDFFTYGGYLSSIAIERYHAFPVVILRYFVACHSAPKVEQSCFAQKSLKQHTELSIYFLQVIHVGMASHLQDLYRLHRRTKHLNLRFEIKEYSHITLLRNFFYCLASAIKICKKKSLVGLTTARERE